MILNSNGDEEEALGAELEEREQEMRGMARMGLRIKEGLERMESEESAAAKEAIGIEILVVFTAFARGFVTALYHSDWRRNTIELEATNSIGDFFWILIFVLLFHDSKADAIKTFIL